MNEMFAALEAQEAEREHWARYNVSGIYVYTYPHYLTHPYHADGRTLLKVGKADKVVTRFRGQIRDTALPEDPELLRIYRTKKPVSVEGQLHRALESHLN